MSFFDVSWSSCGRSSAFTASPPSRCDPGRASGLPADREGRAHGPGRGYAGLDPVIVARATFIGGARQTIEPMPFVLHQSRTRRCGPSRSMPAKRSRALIVYRTFAKARVILPSSMRKVPSRFVPVIVARAGHERPPLPPRLAGEPGDGADARDLGAGALFEDRLVVAGRGRRAVVVERALLDGPRGDAVRVHPARAVREVVGVAAPAVIAK